MHLKVPQKTLSIKLKEGDVHPKCFAKEVTGERGWTDGKPRNTVRNDLAMKMKESETCSEEN